jgi:hypothetical protein
MLMNGQIIIELNEMMNANTYDVNKLNTYYELIMPLLRQENVSQLHQMIAKKIGGCFTLMPRYQFTEKFDIEPATTTCCFRTRDKYGSSQSINNYLSIMTRTREFDLLVMMECLGYIKNNYDEGLMSQLRICFNSI